MAPDDVPEGSEKARSVDETETASAFGSFVEAGEEGGAAPLAVICERTWWSNDNVNFTIGTMVDGLTVTLLVVVTLVSLLVHIYSTDYVAGDRRFTHFFAFLSLFTAAMLFFVTSANVLQMIVGWELVGVCSFALIGHWWEDQDNSDAALKAFLTNRVGDMGLLIGMIILFFASGEKWGIADINAGAISGETSQTLLLIAALCLMAAVMSKSGQFFLHHLAARRYGRPNAGVRADPRCDDGCRRRVPHRPPVRRLLPRSVDRRLEHQRIGDRRRSDHARRRLLGLLCKTTSRRCWPTRPSASSAT